MKHQTATDPETLIVPIRFRRTLDADGRLRVHALSLCPRGERSAEPQECDACPRRRSLAYDPVAQRWHRLCWRDEDTTGVAQGPSAASTPARVATGALLPPEVLCVARDASAARVADVLRDHACEVAVVLDEDGSPLGVITAEEARRALAPREGRYQQRPEFVDELPLRPALAIPEGAPVAEAAAQLAREGAAHLVVLSVEGAVVGAISALDLLAGLAARRTERTERT